MIDERSTPTLYLLIGPPGVGKTTFCSSHMNERDVRISMDDLQQMMGGDRYTNYRPELKNIYKNAELSMMKDALMAGHDVWLDRTNMDRSRRKRYILVADILAAANVRAVNFMAFTPPHVNWLLDRRMLVSRGVPEEQWKDVIEKMLAAYEVPTLDEGFSHIIDVTLEEVTG